MNVTVSNVLTIENPTQDALVWCKRNLVITNPEYAKKARMHFWLGNTPPTLTLYERRGDTLILDVYKRQVLYQSCGFGASD